MELSTTLDIKTITHSPNLCDHLSDEDLDAIGAYCREGVDRDLDSRTDWEQRNADAIKLALQIVENKTFPWQDSSNVKFPLVTIASLQYHARSYPALIPSLTPVECRVIGPDPDGSETERANRISRHMSWQLMEEDDGWEANHDKLLLIQAILGTVFKKSYFDRIKGHNVSELVMPDNLIVNYWTQTLDSSTRVTHRILGITDNTIYERKVMGIYRDVSLYAQEPIQTEATDVADERQGLQRGQIDDTTPYDIMEQHCLLDLDNDGYKEPYIITFDYNSSTVLRVVARFTSSNITMRGDVIQSIKGTCYFTKYGFIPSPDGGFYDLGFGCLLGPLNESVNTAINQLIDSGTMAITGGGFLGRGVKIRGGVHAFEPWEWKTVDSSGDDLRKNIVPLPVNEPSRVLFDLLSLLINYGERIAGAVDVLQGISPGQNTPAETTRTVAQEGLKIFNGIYKRTWRSMKEEFNKLYELNSIFLSEDAYYEDLTTGQVKEISLADYHGNNTRVRPVANPFISSEADRKTQANIVLQWANSTPGANTYEANMRWLDAMHVPATELLYPDPKGPNAIPTPVDPMVQLEQLKQQSAMVKTQLTHKEFMLNYVLNTQKMQAMIENLIAQSQQFQSQAALNATKANGVEAGHQIAQFEAALGAAKQFHTELMDSLKMVKELTSGNTGGMGGMATQPSDQGISGSAQEGPGSD